MRLSQIKIAGFKSFVDPTKIQFPENLTGIVGPNGCGKSNVIDAVRWVMGESSARHLRGESMEDVIFSGSSTRKPVGQASVELIFDNSDGSVKGEYAKYNEISIKRTVTRAGQSKYFLNNSRCRRRDIADIFLGTGLGPRSYAIIEQGMVSRIIDAKPEELRVYLEEAAGISKYKERRRETETRIRHTRENLDRLNDLREEIDKQLARLKRQANTAERYKRLKEEQRRVEAELLLLQRHAFNDQMQRQRQQLEQIETALQAAIAALRKTEAQIEEGHQKLTEANEAHARVQARFYAITSEINTLEQEIAHQKQLRERNRQDLQKILQAADESRGVLQSDEARLQQLEAELATLQPQRAGLADAYEQAQRAASEAETRMTDWQNRWEAFNREYHQAHQAVQVENKAIEHIERQILQADQRVQRLQQEKQSLDVGSYDRQIAELDARIGEREQALQAKQQGLEQRARRINELRSAIDEQGTRLDAQRTEVQNLRGRLSSLEALQQQALDDSDGELQQWLERSGLSGSPRLTEQLRVEPGYEQAVETALAAWLGAFCVGNRTVSVEAMKQLSRQDLALIQQIPGDDRPDAPEGWKPLSAVVDAGVDLLPLLGQTFVCDDRAELERKRPLLKAGQRLVTRDGLMAGRNWLIQPGEGSGRSGVIRREREIQQLRERIEDITEQAMLLKSRVDADREALQREEQARDEEQKALQQIQREINELNNQRARHKSRAEQLQNRHALLEQELEELATQQQSLKDDLQQATFRRNEQLEIINRLEQQKSELESERDRLREQLAVARDSLQSSRERQHELQMKLQALEAQIHSTRFNLERVERQSGEYQQRVAELKQAIESAATPITELEQKLQQALAQKAEVEKQLREAQERVTAIDTEQRAHERLRHDQQQQVDQVRGELEQQNMKLREIEIRRNAIDEQLAKTDFIIDELEQEMPEQAAIPPWRERLDDLTRRINNLGPINLAAIDEFKEQSERKEYLDAQNADLEAALNTLENAIKKIDKETRDRFKETFDAVNSRMQERFPKLFGGGQAHLELTEDDLLTTGVSIMARPPGKRVTNLQLLSGGEKALTAVALIFSIFELNPSPFCMLDEVDAPLDDANVGRFCAMVEEMSEQVQFIFITHNKITMELARTLNGVTMHEPGVSRLVSVDIDEAARLAEA